MTKFIFVTGGVVSGIGKGISAASIGRLLKDRGFSVFMQKFDPYLNIDPGTMSPYQHGEVFVTKDGGETDLDLGHYERFIDEELMKDSSVTSGKIYYSVITKERKGCYEGKTVQVIPHITDEIKAKIYKVARESGADVIITEIGGTVGDIESLPFIEAIRQVHSENKKGDVLFIHATLVPTIPGSDELKTKPTQHSFKELMSYGIKPDVFILRADEPITQEVRDKISLFCDIPTEAIVESSNVDLIYEVPLVLREQGIDNYIIDKLGLEAKEDHRDEWSEMCKKFKSLTKTSDIAIVGKYMKLHDSYLSVIQALLDAGYNESCQVKIHYIDSEDIEKNGPEILKDMDGILVPGGFGERGVEGMIRTSRYAREHQIPFFGICLGMQIASLDIARNVLGLEGAHSTEFHPDAKNPIIHRMESQKGVSNLGGTQRLGNFECALKEGSKARELYGKDLILERHRHRFEFNGDYKEAFEEAGVVFSGINPELDLVEILELKDHPYFIACQFHPEFKSRPNRPHPLFTGLVKAALEK